MKTKPSIPERKTIPVSCNEDGAAGCPLLAHVEDGKISKITDNPNGTPYMKGCSKGFKAMKSGLRSGPAFETIHRINSSYYNVH